MSSGDDGTDILGTTSPGTADGSKAEGPASAETMERGAALGRYILLNPLGAGGVGVVYLAYDPELDRKIAVKLLRPKVMADQSRLRREAQALARLQHPNVVGVHDVGTFQGRVFLAMELVEGTTLAEWLEARSRSWREVVGMFQQAGSGLAAAHAAGLIHRDFKRANVLVGHDGRARVADFGLARSVDVAAVSDAEPGLPASGPPAPLETITRAGTLVGTPASMSPEQFQGLPADARSDQFSFSVALYGALYGERPFGGKSVDEIAAEVTAGRLRPPPKGTRVPAWLRAVVTRGLATAPERRWPSMDALLAALAQDPARLWRRWLLALAAAVIVSVLVVGIRSFERRGEAMCRGAEGKLAGIWDEPRRDAAHAAFVATGRPYAEASFRSVARLLDDYARQWASTYTEACEATHERGEQSAELLDLRMECLGERLQQIRELVDLLGAADGDVVERGVRMASSLPSLGACSDAAALRAPVRPPGDPSRRARLDEIRRTLAEAGPLGLSGKFKEAVARLEPAVAEARSLGYRPVEAQALLTLGKVQWAQGDFQASEASMVDAALAARAGRDASSEVAAWAGTVWAAERLAQYEQAHRWERYGFAAFEALGSADERPLAGLLAASATVFSDEGKADQALAYGQRALAIREKADGLESLPVAQSHEQLARILGNLTRYAEAEREARLALGIEESFYGADHPEPLFARFNLAFALHGEGHDDEALAEYRRCLTIREELFGPEHSSLILTLTNIGDILRIHGQYDAALEYSRRSLEIAERTLGPEHPTTAVALINVGDALRLQGKEDLAVSSYRRAAAIDEKALGPKHPDLAFALMGIGLAQLSQRRPVEALPALERAVAICQSNTCEAPGREEAELALASALWESGGDRARARALAEQARSGYAAAGGTGVRGLAEVEEWIARHAVGAAAP